ncbi:DUF3618 domain-containing protein [Dactylosporangium siamense]|uniref:DUF3618 domain-containing protein n=2 Tax=Dactylosporangium siamense TaxID=685454 RepID=A0A919PXT2_9ACTN|nr:DUF3618 domain-containing protein [Dactylosporangium siamense]GIG51632.1 hypothetical protein Dsi01nite_096730 [Dactylosporangium siamense]
MAPTTADPQQLRAEIARTRVALGETVEALAAKVDVKARAKDAAAGLAHRAQARTVAAAGRLRDQASSAATTVAERAATTTGPLVVAARDPHGWRRLRRPVPAAVLSTAVTVAVALVVFGVRGRRR